MNTIALQHIAILLGNDTAMVSSSRESVSDFVSIVDPFLLREADVYDQDIRLQSSLYLHEFFHAILLPTGLALCKFDRGYTCFECSH